MNTIKKILFVTMMFAYHVDYAQTVVNLNTPQSGTLDNVARDEVNFKDGYSYKGIGTNEMHGYTNYTLPGDISNTGTLYQDYAGATSLSQRQINQSYAVGSISGNASVTANGGSSYNITFSLPTAFVSTTPSISINYSSQSGNSILGMGWNLSVLSAITRSGQTIYHNGKTEGILLSSEKDSYVMDGARLIAISGTNGNPNTQYATEAESFSKIISVGNSGNGPESFTVETKDGRKLLYGADAQARFYASDNNTVLIWYLRRISDLNGNYIDYSYSNVGGQIVLSQISYTSNDAANLNPSHKVKFLYDERADDNTTYIAGKGIKSHLILDKIQILSEGVLFREYQFKYALRIYNFLSEVIEFGTDGSRFNSTAFQYGDQQSQVMKFPSVLNNQNGELMSGDYTGDGITDVLVSSVVTSGSNTYIDNLKLYKGSITGEFTYVTTVPFPSDYNLQTWAGGINFVPLNAFSSSDFNGDGKQDFLIKSKFIDYAGKTSINKIRIYTSQGSSFTYQEYSMHNPYFIDLTETHLQIGDFDGDGASDILTAFRGWTTGSNGYLKMTDETEYTIYYPVRQEKLVFTSTTLLSGIFRTIDFDGDGKHDIMSTDGNSTAVYEFTRNSETSVSITTLYQSGYPTQEFHITYLGDFNGDGKTDLLTKSSSGVWDVSYSKGNGFEGGSINIGDPSTTAGGLKIGDYNGDGKADIIYYSTNAGGATHVSIRYSNGNGFEAPVDVNTGQSLNLAGIYSGDFNGDSKLDDLIFTASSSNTSMILWNKEDNSRLLIRAADGYNNIDEFTYVPSTNTVVYSKTLNCGFPCNTLTTPLILVQSHKKPNGNGGTLVNTYQYRDAIVHKQGKGFLGMMGMTITNTESNRKIETTISLDQSIGGVYQITQALTSVKKLSDNSILSNSNTFFSCSRYLPLSSKRYKFLLDRTVTNDFLAHKDNVVYNEQYDNYGNVLKKSNTTSLNGVDVQSDVIETTYGQFGTWLPYNTTSVKVTNTRIVEGETPIVKKVSFSSYDNKGNMLSSVADPDDAKALTTTVNSLNPFGGVISSTISAAGVPSITRSLDYDSKGRIVRKYNALQQLEEITYDVFGRVIKSKDITGQTTEYTYDGFDRIASTKLPTGVVVTNSLGWDPKAGNNSDISNVSTTYYSVTAAASSPTVQTWFDSFGRQKVNKIDGFQVTYSSTLYDNKGNVYVTTSPYLTPGTAIKTTYEYYDDNRIQKITQDGLAPTNYSYTFAAGNITTSVSSPNGNVVSVVDATGKTKSVTDDNGTLSYKYYSNGNLKSVALGTIEMLSMQYDIHGNKTQTIDNSAGTIVYIYNAYDQLISQSDNGKVTTYAYDIMGRITNKSTSEGTTAFEYNTSGKALNAIKKITGVGGMMQEYSYSADFGRLISLKETIGSDIFETKFEFNTIGQQTKMIYPSGFAVKKHYTNKGELFKLTDNAEVTTIWQRTSMNQYGQYTEYSTGDGKITKKEYDPYGIPKRFYAAGVYDIGMTINPETGNLMSRKDNLLGLVENFDYDKNRLKFSQIVGQPQIDVVYQPNGNIEKKTGVGDYKYHPTKINAIDNITPPVATDFTSSAIPQSQENVDYTSFNKAKSIRKNNTESELIISYGVDNQRRKTEMKQNGTSTFTRFFLSSYEKTVEGSNTTEVNYINSPDGIIAMYVVENGGTGQFHYLCKDQLGSPLVVTSNSGVEYKQSFDPWGRRRNPSNWTYDLSSYTTPQPKWMYRGYTGHEHLPDFTLINMNGRMYDPIIGRMLSPDNYVQSADFSQNYNRYAYCLNNPLKYVDPSGNYYEQLPPSYGIKLRNDVARAQVQHDFYEGRQMILDGAAGPNAQRQEVMKMSMEQVDARNFRDEMRRLEGNTGYTKNSRGMLLDILDAAVSLTPVFGPLVGFIRAADRGDVRGAIVNVALGALDMGAVASYGTRAVSSSESGFARESFSAEAGYAERGYAEEAAYSSGGNVGRSEFSAAETASSWQGKGAYSGVDSWREITLKDGTNVVGGVPGQTEFYTTMSGLERSEYSKQIWEGLQVKPHDVRGPRTEVGIYTVVGDTPAAFGTTYANPQFGAGGLPQIFIPNFEGLKLVETIPLK
ncbi:MAG: FG-GAP-like repeat-containing protein [Bacteroidetes bacterium]|nr:FG-GAP-like repeat-containing protein [Bacteroidota bacterium]